MTGRTKALYALPCAFGHPDDTDDDTLFFTTFHTRDEVEAFRLASCICGPKGKRALVIIDESGEIYHLD